MKKLLALLLVLTLFLPALAAAETIVTSFYPVWILTLNLTEGIESVKVVNLAAPTTGCAMLLLTKEITALPAGRKNFLTLRRKL